jgi:anti-sigma-K factor RskA
MDYRNKPELIDRLAAEYVLGTLAGGARRRFVSWMQRDASLRSSVTEWEKRLAPMTSMVAPAEPSPQVWQSIAAAIGPAKPAGPAVGPAGIWESLAFWRGFGLATTGLAAALLVFIGVRPPEIVERVQVVERTVEKPLRVSDGANPWQPSYVATLTDASGKTMLMIYVGRNSDELWVKYEGDSMPKDASLELWGLDEGGQPKSLGLIKNNGRNMMKLPAMADQSVAAFKKLAVSMEPMGGSTKGTPTGPVMYQGECHTFW